MLASVPPPCRAPGTADLPGATIGFTADDAPSAGDVVVTQVAANGRRLTDRRLLHGDLGWLR